MFQMGMALLTIIEHLDIIEDALLGPGAPAATEIALYHALGTLTVPKSSREFF